MTKGPFESEELNKRLEQLQIEANAGWSQLIIGAVCIYSITFLVWAILGAN